MNRNRTISAAELDEVLVEEVLSEGAGPYAEVFHKLQSADRDSERYRELACELAVAANVLAVKARVAEELIEEYLDALRDDE